MRLKELDKYVENLKEEKIASRRGNVYTYKIADKKIIREFTKFKSVFISYLKVKDSLFVVLHYKHKEVILKGV